MVEYELLKQNIEQEYDLVIADEQRDKGHLFELISQYIKRTIEITLSYGYRANKEDVEDVLQTTMMAVFETGLSSYRKQGKSFAGYCCMIAKNKAIDFLKKRRFDKIELISVNRDLSDDEKIDLLLNYESKEFIDNQDSRLLFMERKLEQISILKDLISKLLNLKEKAYRTVGFCYTVILFQLLNPKAKELSSPQWAFDEIKDRTIQYSADRFIFEFNNRIGIGKVSWGPYFYDSMESEEFGILVCDMIFGEYFDRKDLENWCVRIRKKLLKDICYELD